MPGSQSHPTVNWFAALWALPQNARAALEVSNRAFVMVSGRIARSGNVPDLLDDALIRDAYLGG
jgi:ABC-type branched-subunit amino acid transport system ATPase component